MGLAGETWNCPHCGELILRSVVICPACQRRLRVDAVAAVRSAPTTIYPLSVEGVIRHPGTETPWEYSILVEVRDSQGEVINRRVVGVGAIGLGDSRTFALRVEMRTPDASSHAGVPSRTSASEDTTRATPSGARRQEAGLTQSSSPVKSPGRPK
jgi:hypothetical protein